MNSLSNRAEPLGGSARAGRGRVVYGVKGAVGALIGAALLLAGVLLLVVVAATLAIGTAVTAVLLALSAVAWRLRPRPMAQGARASAVPVGHAWVAYRWEPPAR